MTELGALDAAVIEFQGKVEAIILAYEEDIALENRLLDECLKNQITLQIEFERLHAKAKGLEQQAKALMEQYHSYAFTAAMKSKSQRPESTTEARMYADCDADYIAAVKVYNKIYKTQLEVNGIIDTLITRKFVLTNLTNAVIEGVNKHIL